MSYVLKMVDYKLLKSIQFKELVFGNRKVLSYSTEKRTLWKELSFYGKATTISEKQRQPVGQYRGTRCIRQPPLLKCHTKRTKQKKQLQKFCQTISCCHCGKTYHSFVVHRNHPTSRRCGKPSQTLFQESLI